MSKPAARVGDLHACPAYNGKKPHVGGPIITGSPNVLIGGQPAARVGDQAVCTGDGIDTIVHGSSTVFVNGRPLALMGSLTAHGGVVVSGAPNVQVGDITPAPISPSTAAPSTQIQAQAPTPDPFFTAASKQTSTDNRSPQQTDQQSATAVSTADISGESLAAQTPHEPTLTDPATPTPANPDNRHLADSAPPSPEMETGAAQASSDSESDTPVVTQTVKVVTGMFFDGTANNAGNTMARRRLEDQCLTAYEAGALTKEECDKELAQLAALGSSPFNNLTNVAKLHDLYRDIPQKSVAERVEYVRIYVDGIGTKTGSKDSDYSQGTGMGSLGVIAKVVGGSEKLASELRKHSAFKIERLTLDIFGFSRGAAAARHFANEVLKGPDGILGQALATKDIPWPQQVEIRFIGLFDTVAAITHVLGGDFSPHNAQNAPLNIDLPPGRIRHVVQLAARDEQRHNFSLNSLRSPDGSLPTNFQEWTLPGVHSDIGGGYLPKDKENLLVAPPVILQGLEREWPERSDAYLHLETLRRQLEKEGWLGVHNQPPGRYYIEVERRNQPRGEGHVLLKLRLERDVRGEYSRIPLWLMHELARRQGVPLNDIDPTDPDWTIPHELDSAVHPLREHVLEGAPLHLTEQMESLLKQRYLHHSHHYGAMGIFRPHRPVRWKRGIHPNHPTG